MTAHLSEQDLLRWRDAPSDVDRSRVVEHLSTCDACSARYAELIRTRPLDRVEPTLDVTDFVTAGLAHAPSASPHAVGSGVRPEDRPSAPILRPAFRPRPVFRYAVGMAAVLMLAALVWQGVESQRLRTRIAQLESEHSRELQDERTARARLEQELAGQREPATSGRAIPRPVISLFLAPGRVRAAGETKTVTIPSNDIDVRLVLDLGEKRAYRSYDADVVNADGAIVWTRRGLPAEQLVIVTIPAKVLPEDDYEINLKGITVAGASERVGEYAFTVLKK